jgi:ribulose-5-phosphate 4-epimerase/fuculose-1-phosphate aldolase
MVLGQDMPSAFAKADLLENYAKMLINAKILGGAYKLSDDQLHDIVSG